MTQQRAQESNAETSELRGIAGKTETDRMTFRGERAA